MTTVSPHAKKGKTHTVYALIDPRDNAVRYIGITHDVYQRMRQHSRCIGDNEQKNAWIQELQDLQLMFHMHVIEQVSTVEKALERESYWIHHYLQQGIPLLNISGTKLPEPSQTNVTPTRPQRVGFIRYSSAKFLYKLYFPDENGDLLNCSKATGRQFAAYLDRYIEYDWSKEDLDSEFNKWNGGGWRCHVLNDLRLAGIPLEIYNYRGERVTDLTGNPLKPQTASETI